MDWKMAGPEVDISAEDHWVHISQMAGLDAEGGLLPPSVQVTISIAPCQFWTNGAR
jgi:hypothetical protein